MHFYSEMDKRLLGVFLIFGKWPLKFWGVIWPKDSLVLGWSGQKTPWCWGDLDKRLLGASQGWISTKESFVQTTPTQRSLLSRSPQHQGVFWPDQKSQKLKLQVSFLGLNIALTPNLTGSSDADFHKDSESGLNSKIKKTPSVTPSHTNHKSWTQVFCFRLCIYSLVSKIRRKLPQNQKLPGEQKRKYKYCETTDDFLSKRAT